MRFDALRKIFLAAATADSSEWNDPRPEEYMKVCRELTSAQLIILATAHKLNKKMTPEEKSRIHGFEAWNQAMERGSDGKLSIGIIMRNEEALIEKRLIGDRIHTDRSGIQKENSFRLDTLGIEFCDYLEKYKEKG